MFEIQLADKMIGTAQPYSILQVALCCTLQSAPHTQALYSCECELWVAMEYLDGGALNDIVCACMLTLTLITQQTPREYNFKLEYKGICQERAVHHRVELVLPLEAAVAHSH